MYTPYPFQQENFDQLRRAFASGSKRVLYQAGTGSGKTVVASMAIAMAEGKETRTLVLAHRRELILQMAEKLENMNVVPGIVMSGHVPNIARTTQVGSIQTLNVRFLKRQKLKLIKPRLIVIDEAHRSLSKTYLSILERFPDAFVLGLTATPVRSDGRGLGHVYDDMVCAPSIKQLTDDGYLVPVIPFVGEIPDLKGIKKIAREYSKKELEERMNKPKLVGDCVENWLRHAKGRQTICFSSGIRHSIALAEEFRLAGVRAVHVDGTTKKDERDKALYDLRNKNIDVVTNCMVYTEGTDCPIVSCIQDANPSTIISKYLQKIGRGMRTHEESGKKNCIYLDHSGGTLKHGFIDEPIPWSLDKNGDLYEDLKLAREKLPKQFTCKDCGCVFQSRIRCPECGAKLEMQGRLVNYADGELMQMTREAPPKEPVYSRGDRQKFYSELLGYASGMGRANKEKKYSDAWAAHKYRVKFGVWPNGMDKKIEKPSQITISFIRSQNIRWSFEKKKRENMGVGS